MKLGFVYLITVVIVFTFYSRVSNSIYRYENRNVNENNLKEFYLYSIDRSRISISKVDFNSVDIPNRISTNQYNKITREGYIEESSIPVEGFIGRNGDYSMGGISIDEDNLCLKIYSDEKLCIQKLGHLPIPVIDDVDFDKKDEFLVYYFDTGELLVYEIDRKANALKVTNEFKLPANGFPIIFSKKNKKYFGTWVESKNPILYFIEYLNREKFVESMQFGLEGDIPFSLDFLCEGNSVFGVYRRTNQTWYFLDHESIRMGTINGIPVNFDYNKDGCPDISLYDRKNRNNLIILPSSINLKNLHIFPNGHGLVYMSRLDSLEHRPIAYWNYERYKKYKSISKP